MIEEESAVNGPLTAFIIDDDPSAIGELQKLSATCQPEISVLGSSGSALEALLKVKTLKPAIIFVDIDIFWLHGTEAIEHLGRGGHAVIFLTSVSHYAYDVLDRHGMNYLLKPFAAKDLCSNVKRAIQRSLPHAPVQYYALKKLFAELFHTPESNKLLLPSSRGFAVADLSEIIRIQSNGPKSCTVYTADKKIAVSKGIGEFEKLLHNTSFLRVHNVHIINIDFLDAFEHSDGGMAIMQDKKAIPIARRKLTLFKELVKKTYEHF